MSKLKYMCSWLPVILIMIIIFSFSAKEADISGRTSSGITDKVVKVIELVTNDQINEDSVRYDKIHTVVRKCGHFLEYMALGCTFVLPYILTVNNKPTAFVLCQLSSTFYACTDEFHQIFVDGRNGNLVDVGIDSAGAFVGIITGFICLFIINKCFVKGSKKICTII